MNDPFAPSPAGKPNFFLLGAGRCGTTTLHSMLQQHPEIFMSQVKEPSFFCSYFQVVKNPVDYFRLFNPKKSEKAIGEASHVYLSNPESAPVIHQLFPDVKFILIFRNPTERAYSLYNFMQAAKFESLAAFEEAVEAEDHRFADPDFFKNCPQYFWNFMYLRSSCYDVQWQRYLRFYPRSSFFPLSLYELTADPSLWMKRIYEFLGVDNDFRPSFDRLNAVSYPPMLAATKEKLDRYFREVISRTEEIAGRDMNLRHA
jgi:hypothetical protein